MKEGTGTLWRIRRTTGRQGTRPPRPRAVPTYAFLFYVPLLALLAAAAGAIRLLLRRLR
jgi:hypothetical protein